MADKEYEYTDDYYKMLQDENYKTLLDREIQLNNSRERALRQTNANLAGLGLASAGYGQTAKSSVESQYLNALNSAEDTYQEQSIANKDAAIQYGNDRFDAFLAKLDAYDMYDEDERNRTLQEYGVLNDDGTLNEEELYKRYGEDSVRDFKAMYQKWQDGSGATTEEDEADKANKDATNDEMNFLTGNDKNNLDGKEFYNNLKEGDVVKLSGNEKDIHQKYYKFQNGKLVECSKEDYEKAKSKYWIRSHENSKDMIVDYNGKTIYDKSTANIKQNNKNAKIAGIVLTALGLGPVGGLTAIGGGIGSAANAKDEKTINDNYNWYLEQMKG